jgi:hypothetical protein
VCCTGRRTIQTKQRASLSGALAVSRSENEGTPEPLFFSAATGPKKNFFLGRSVHLLPLEARHDGDERVRLLVLRSRKYIFPVQVDDWMPTVLRRVKYTHCWYHKVYDDQFVLVIRPK